MHGTIWRHIRTRHADLYRIAALVQLWRETRTMRSTISAGTAGGLLLSARLLPEAWFNNLFFWLLIKTRAQRIESGELQAGEMPGIWKRVRGRGAGHAIEIYPISKIGFVLPIYNF
jgi:hypothetical protein